MVLNSTLLNDQVRQLLDNGNTVRPFSIPFHGLVTFPHTMNAMEGHDSVSVTFHKVTMHSTIESVTTDAAAVSKHTLSHLM